MWPNIRYSYLAACTKIDLSRETSNRSFLTQRTYRTPSNHIARTRIAAPINEPLIVLLVLEPNRARHPGPSELRARRGRGSSRGTSEQRAARRGRTGLQCGRRVRAALETTTALGKH